MNFQQEIFDLSHYGKNIGSYWEIYHMPISVRKLMLNMLKENIKAANNDPTKITMEDMAKGKRSQKSADYISKAPLPKK